jgi:hypothetical protein
VIDLGNWKTLAIVAAFMLALGCTASTQAQATGAGGECGEQVVRLVDERDMAVREAAQVRQAASICNESLRLCARVCHDSQNSSR